MALRLISVFICTTFIITANCGNIPSYINVCKRTDPEVSKCIKESAELLRPRLKNGIKELGVPKLEPLRIPDVDITRGVFNINAILRQVDVYGGSDFHITKLKANIPSLSFRIEVVLPLLRMVGIYDINARLVIPIQEMGRFSANITNIVGKGVLHAELNERNGTKYMNFTELDMRLNIGDYHLHVDSLYDGDQNLGSSTNDLLNDNRQEFIYFATPYIERQANRIILGEANKVLKRTSFDEFLPEN